MAYYQTIVTRKMKNEKKINTVLDVYSFLRKITKSRQENCILLTLSSENAIIGTHIICVGSSDSAAAPVSEIFYKAIIDNASKIIVCHNHPGGSLEPSDSDFRNAYSIGLAGGIFGIDLELYMIVGETGYTRLDPGDKKIFMPDVKKEEMTYKTVITDVYDAKNVISDPGDLYKYVSALYQGKEGKDQMVIISLNNMKEVIRTYFICENEIDAINAGALDPKDIISDLLVDKASDMAVCCIRSSEDIMPTENDYKNYENIISIENIFKISLAYYLILNKKGFSEIKRYKE